MGKHAPQRVQSGIHAHPQFMRPTTAALAVAACFSAPALANPVNPTVVHGTASFAQAGNILNITNSHNAIINWGSFSIGVNELTRFIQPSALSAVLNRVTGQDPSAILGALQSNGRVFLLNPNGIVFGAGSQINVAGLVASTLNLSNDDFLNNRMRFTDGAGAGSVVNNGSITGGSVYLVGNAVTNNGLISSPGGEVVLAAGNSVELVNPGTPNLRVEVVAPDNEARNLGTISAEAGRIGIYAGLINNSGTLNASSAVAEGGRILLKAKKDITLTSTSVLDASGKGGGEIIALADNNTHVDGRLNASAPVSGNGGFIETSGKNRVRVASSALVSTAAPQGKTGTWLIDPNDFVIGTNADMDGATIASNLASTNFVISTAMASGSYGGGNGDILVQDAISWNSGNSLTLTAERNVQVDQPITNLGTGAINLNAGWDTVSPAGTPTLTNPAGGILLNAAMSTGGTVNLHAVSSISQGVSAPIMATDLQAVSNNGAVNLDGSTNSVGTLAGSAVGTFLFKNSGNLTIGSVGSSNGISVSPGFSRDAMISVDVTGGQLTVNSPVSATGGDGSEGQAGGNATINLTSSSSMQINSSVSADGGEGGGSYFFAPPGPAGAGGNATITLTSGGGMVVAGNVQATGGQGGSGSSARDGGRGGDGVVNLIVAGTMSMGAYGGTIIGQGGLGGYSSFGGGMGGRGGDGKVMLSAVGGITVANGRLIKGQGGDGGNGGTSYSYGGAAAGGNGGDGVVQLTSTGGSIAVSGAVVAQGGSGGNGGGGSAGNDGNGGNGSLNLTSATGITVSSGATVHAYGGDAGSNSFNAAAGGTATAVLNSAGAISITDTSVVASGGDGGEYGAGGNALTLLSSGGNTTLNNGGAAAFGGFGDTGGAAAVTMLAGGNIQMEGGEGMVQGGFGNTALGNGAIMLVAGGNISMANQSMALLTINGNVNSVIVAAAGDVSLLNTDISSGGTLGLGGANIMLDNATASAASSVSATATGSLGLVNNSVLSGNNNAYVTTGGNVNVDSGSTIFGGPDVFLNVGGVINMNNAGTIQAAAPVTLHLMFPMLTSGGFFVNGIEGVVFDPLTGTGFKANGSPAVLGVNLLMTYGGGNNLTVPTDALIVAMGESTKSPDPEKDKDVFEDLKKDKEKEAPVCR